MRPKRRLRKARPAHVALGALMVATPASAVALAAGQADAQSAVQIDVGSGHVPLGHHIRVTGNAAGMPAGQPLSLQFSGAGSPGWRTLATERVSGGHFRFEVPLRESGLLRAVPAGTATTRFGPRLTGSAPGIAPSVPHRITVGSRLNVSTAAANLLSGQGVDVAGRLLPGVAGRRVELVTRAGNGWRTLARATTGPRGGFRLHYGAGGLGERWLRVRFGGDRLNTPSLSAPKDMTVYRQSVASWYDDAGATACGFHAVYGVASLSAPCGAQVKFRYGGRTVTATVDDRGPYVGGRDWDLNQNTASALGFGGVDTVWSSM